MHLWPPLDRASAAPWNRSERGGRARRGDVAWARKVQNRYPVDVRRRRRRKGRLDFVRGRSPMTQEMIFGANHDVAWPACLTHPPAAEDIGAAKAFIIAEGSQLCAAAVGHDARAVVLTGSMSRNEATLKKDGESWRVLGDATFLIVFDRPVRLGIAELEREIERRLLARGIRCKIVVVTSTSAELRKMRPHIYAYELRERGVVVWGDRQVLHLMPRFTPADIPKQDGWWFLCNRMIEQLESAADANSENDPAVRYRIAKLYLAMAACYLLEIGQYEPSYRERAAHLQQLAASDDPQPEPIPLQRFAKFVSRCTDLKLHGEKVVLRNDFPQWRDAVSDAEALWRWALSRILGLNPSLGRTDLLAALAARQSIFARAKGWVRAACVQPLTFSRYGLRWARLACSTSPRYLVYEAASEFFFTAPYRDAIMPSELAAIVARLPLPQGEADQQVSWRTVAKLVARNFHVLLESTRS